jgi:hypothetical protein
LTPLHFLPFDNVVQLDKEHAHDQVASVKRVLLDFTTLFYILVPVSVFVIYGIISTPVWTTVKALRIVNSTSPRIDTLHFVSGSFIVINVQLIMFVVFVEYSSMTIVAPLHYERAFTKSGMVLRKTLAQTRGESLESKDLSSEDDELHQHLRSRRATSIEDDGRTLEDYRMNYIQARNTVRQHVQFYSTPVSIIVVASFLQMLSCFIAMYKDSTKIWHTLDTLFALLPVVLLLFPTTRANFKFDDFSTFVVENTDFSFEFAARYLVYIQRHPPVYLTVCGVAMNKLLLITLLTSTATMLLIFGAKNAPAFASDFLDCPLTHGCY